MLSHYMSSVCLSVCFSLKQGLIIYIALTAALDLLYRPGWPQTHKDLLASALHPGVLGLKVCTTTPSSFHHFLKKEKHIKTRGIAGTK